MAVTSTGQDFRPGHNAPSLAPEAETAPWRAHYPENVPTHLGYPSRAAWCLLKRAADKSPDRVACWHLDESWTYAELWSRAQVAATRLASLGVRPGHRVTLMLPNMPEYLVALNGAWLAGATVVAASPLMVPSEVGRLIEATRSRVLITLDVLAGLVPTGAAAPETVLVVSMQQRLASFRRVAYALARLLKFRLGRPSGSTRWLDWDTHVPDSSGRTLDPTSSLSSPMGLMSEPDVRAGFEPGRPALILPTGGTTGMPRSVVLTHGNLVANAWQIYHWAGRRTAEDTLLAVLPFFHSYGLSTCALAGTAMQATLVMHHRFQVGQVLDLFRRHRPTIFPAVPAMLVALNERLRQGRRDDVCTLETCISGGAGLPEEVAEEFSNHTGAVVVEGYGLSEAGPVTHAGPLDGNARPGTIGLPLPDTLARVVDIEDPERVLGPGEVGQLMVRGPQVMAGYLDEPDATREVLADGWLATGDMAEFDEDGFFTIVDRLKDLVITSGFNVYPAEVEAVLRECPGVADAAVIGVPDPVRGERVKAILSREPGHAIDLAEIESHLANQLARHKRPREFEIIDGDLPRNFLGKVLRRHLREQGPDAHAGSLIETAGSVD